MNNPALETWEGPGGGLPAFDKVKPSDIAPAFDLALAAHRRELAEIVNAVEPPTFTNVFGRLEDAGGQVSRVMAYYGVYRSTMKSAEVRTLETEIEPRLAAMGDELIQNQKLFAKMEAVAAAADRLGAEERRLVEVRLRKFVLRGARLDAAAKARVAAINQRLAVLGTEFSAAILDAESEPALVLEQDSDLDGCPKSFREAARAEGERIGRPGRYVVANTRSSVEVFLSFASRRDLRERAFKVWSSRGAEVNPPRVRETLALRRERAALLGFASHAHWTLADRMIKTPADALALMDRVWGPAVARARRDIADMQALSDRRGDDVRLEAWDHRFYAEILRREKYDLDPNMVRPYLRFEHVRDAMFVVANKLYGLTFKKIAAPTYHPDVTVYEVHDARGVTGVFYLDPFARPGKESGAWMSHYRPQREMNGQRRPPIVSNNSNFTMGAGGAPTELSWDDARTMFHEFGHGVHGLLSDVRFPYLQGTAVATDYVEFPSHFHENYLRTDEVLSRLVDGAGRPMPRDLIDKIKRAETFNLGFATVEFLANAILDMRLHLAGDVTDPATFAESLFREIGLPTEIPPRHALGHFAHAFHGDHYSAGYYSYLWSDVMASDGFEAFTETGDAYNPEVARRLRECVLSAGNTIDPAEGYRRFRGRDPDSDALLRARGLIEAESAR